MKFLHMHTCGHNTYATLQQNQELLPVYVTKDKCLAKIVQPISLNGLMYNLWWLNIEPKLSHHWLNINPVSRLMNYG